MLECLRLAQAGDPAAREDMVKNNTGLVWSAVRRFIRSGEDPEDLFQIGCVGLMKAIDKFDPAYQVQFSTYAVPLIIGEIRRHLRDQGQLKVSRSLKELVARVSRTRAALAASDGTEPTVAAIAAALDIAPADVVEAMEATRPLAHLEEQIGGDDVDPVLLQDRVELQQAGESQWLNQVAVRQSLGCLDSRLRKVILLRFFADRTQSEVAAAMGLSQAQVSRLERQALAELRAMLEPGFTP